MFCFAIISFVFYAISNTIVKEDRLAVTGKSTMQGSVQTSIDPGIKVMYAAFTGNTTTSFIMLNDSQLAGVQNMTLEISDIAKVVFNEQINLTEDAANNTLDLSAYINLSTNRIEINTTTLTGLQKSATIYIYNLNFTDPVILKNGVACPAADCIKISYTNSTLIFNVTHFTVYSAAENPTVPAPVLQVSGGAMIVNFSIDKDLIKVRLKQGESKRETVLVKNTVGAAVSIAVTLKNLKGFAVASEDSFSLQPYGEKAVNIDFFAEESQPANAYTGNIILFGGSEYRTINVIFEVAERMPLFDMKTKMLKSKIIAKQQAEANISIVNVGDLKIGDVLLYYAIKTLDGQIITSSEESIAVNKEKNIIISLNASQSPPGKYLFYSKISYKNQTAVSSDLFEIVEKETETEEREGATEAAKTIKTEQPAQLKPQDRTSAMIGMFIIMAAILIIINTIKTRRKIKKS